MIIGVVTKHMEVKITDLYMNVYYPTKESYNSNKWLIICGDCTQTNLALYDAEIIWGLNECSHATLHHSLHA